ncbi:hypothetical protein GQ473_06305 [archaeon]|nr:hypothetical protein [archaeon]
MDGMRLMKLLNRFVFVLVMLFVVNSSGVHAIALGTAPGVRDMGDVVRGQDLPVEFYLTSNTNKPLIVTTAYIPVHMDMYKTEKRTYYTFIPSESSQEDISSWISFPENPLLVSPGKQKVIRMPDGTSIKYNQKVTVILKIPKDAEPGYHAGAINLNPVIQSEDGSGTSVSTIGITRFVFVFKIPGPAVREGNIIDFVAERNSDKKVQVDVLFKNTGTTTITASPDKIKIFDNYGVVKDNIAAGQIKRIAPGRTEIISGYWYDDTGIDAGNYRAEATINYITGMATKESIIHVPAEITIPDVEIPKTKNETPWWFILIIMALIGLYVYWKMD